MPLLIDEPTSEACGVLWDSAEHVTTTRLTYIEAAAALAQAERTRRISVAHARDARAVLDELWPAVDVIELDPQLMSMAATFAAIHRLRGHDATHCAAAVTANDAQLVAASGDGRLLAAWQAEAVATSDTTT